MRRGFHRRDEPEQRDRRLRYFAPGRALMSYVGLVPSERSSGEQRLLASLTKSGSRHARRLLVEAATASLVESDGEPGIARGAFGARQGDPDA